MKRKPSFVVIVVWIFGIVIISLATYAVFFQNYPICQGEERNNIEIRCCDGCNELGLKYLHYTYEIGGWGREVTDDCFCINGTQSIQLY